MVESLESRLLIGREPPPEIFKGVTLTILIYRFQSQGGVTEPEFHWAGALNPN